MWLIIEAGYRGAHYLSLRATKARWKFVLNFLWLREFNSELTKMFCAVSLLKWRVSKFAPATPLIAALKIVFLTSMICWSHSIPVETGAFASNTLYWSDKSHFFSLQKPNDVIKRVAHFLEKDLTAEQLANISTQSEFSQMKKNPITNFSELESIGIINSRISRFMRTGKQGSLWPSGKRWTTSSGKNLATYWQRTDLE